MIKREELQMNKVAAKEMNIDVEGYSFLCIFGEHINGGFLAIPNWNVCVELGDENDFAYNSDRIYTTILNIKILNGCCSQIADTLANEIRKEGY